MPQSASIAAAPAEPPTTAETPELNATTYDVFNGDADGLCALHQLRLAEPCTGTLITGVKRDIALLRQVPLQPGIQVNVFDISLDSNSDALQALLASGASVRYFDHHSAARLQPHPGLESHIDQAPDVCTSLLVDRHLQGRYRHWAIAAAFGDNLNAVATRLASAAGLSAGQTGQLRQLGELLNYNAYGEQVSDLCYPPEQLYRAMQPYASPFDFIAAAPQFATLAACHADDNARLGQLQPLVQQPHAAVYRLPAEKWARRISGILANRLTETDPHKAYAILSSSADASLVVSVRAPKDSRHSAAGLCSQYPSGGGRVAAGGINHLPASEVDAFIGRFFAYFAD